MSMTKKLRITLEDRSYDVTVELLDQPAGETEHREFDNQSSPHANPPRVSVSANAAAPVEASAPAARRPAAQPGEVLSPLAGTVLGVEVKAGQAVKPNDVLVMLEAMKMRTPVRAQSPGTVQSIQVSVGASVQEGSVLLTLA